MSEDRRPGRVFLLSLACIFVLFLAPSASSQPPTGYPIESFLGLTTFPEVAMAPKAKRLAFITSVDNFAKDRTEQAVWRLELLGKDGEAQTGKPVRLTWTPGGYSKLRWSPDGRRLAFLAARGPTRMPQLFVVRVRAGQPAQVSFHPKGVTAYDWGPDSETLYFSCPEVREGDQKGSGVIRLPGPPESFAIFRQKLGSDQRSAKLATVPHTVADLAVAPDGKRLAYLDVSAHDPLVFVAGLEDHEIYLLPTGEKDASPHRLTHNRLLEIDLAWTAGSDALYGLATGDPDSAEGQFTPQRVIRFDASTGAAQVLASGFEGAFKELTTLPDGGKDMILAAANVSTHTNLYSLSAALSPKKGRGKNPPKTRQRSFLQGTVTRPAAASGSPKVAFVLSSSTEFPEIHLADDFESLDHAVTVTRFNRQLAKLRPPEIETVRWSTEGGSEIEEETEIEGVVYWPPGKRGTEGLPLIVDLHGGPWGARNEELAFNGNVNFAYFPSLLASRGFLVLAPNYRGGTGRGDAFFAAVNGFSCSRPAADVLTGVDFLVQSGWADPDRLAVIGYSYGGLVTNCLLGRTERFRAAVSGAGIWNDVSYFGTADNFMQTDVRYDGAAPWENFEMYWRESAMSGAARVTTPTLITHGGSDRRVPSAQAFELYRALRRQGVRAELLIFPDQGHIFSQPSHKLEKVRAEVAWLEEHLETPPRNSLGETDPAIAGASPER